MQLLAGSKVERVATDGKSEIRSLNGLRGIAALSVALGHYQVGDLVPGLANLYWWKVPAVDLFFCLSGFTLGLAYKAGEIERLQLRNYLVARIARICPLYFITFFMFLLFLPNLPIMTHFDYSISIIEYVSQLLMVNSWPIIGTYRHLDDPAWTISIEFFCYIVVFPGLFYVSTWMLRVGGRTRLILATALAAGAAYVLLTYCTAEIFICRRYICKLPETAYLGPVLRGVLGFAAGWLVYLSFMSHDRLSLWAVRHADSIALAVLVLLGVGITGILPIQWMIIGFPVLLLGVSSGDSRAAKVLSWRPVHYLGSISYSIYLMHRPWAHLWRWGSGLIGLTFVWNGPGSKVTVTMYAMYGVLLVGLIVISSLSYHAFEMPARRIVRAAWRTTGGGPLSKPNPVATARWSMLAALAALAVVGAGFAGLYHPIGTPKVALGEDIVRSPTFERAAWKGWSSREGSGIWSVGPDSLVGVRVADREVVPDRLGLFVKGSFFLTDRHPALIARVAVNDVEVGVFRPTTANPEVEAFLPLPPAASPRAGESVRIELSIDTPASPKSLGLSEDSRDLGMYLQSMKLVGR